MEYYLCKYYLLNCVSSETMQKHYKILCLDFCTTPQICGIYNYTHCYVSVQNTVINILSGVSPPPLTLIV